ncbi:MAG: FtsX-like permease family protein, partial [Gemmatimonadaceae bacterium]
PRMMIFVRTAGDPSAMAPSVRAAIRNTAPRNPIYDVQTMSGRVATASAQTRFSATLLGLFAAVALSLAIMGIYGVMSFAVAQRTREIGIRMALGARRSSVLGLVVREGAILAGMGVVIGLMAALALTRVMRSMLFEVTTSDPWTYIAMVVVLAGAALVASLFPARRAAGVDPVSALRKG